MHEKVNYIYKKINIHGVLYYNCWCYTLQKPRNSNQSITLKLSIQTIRYIQMKQTNFYETMTLVHVSIEHDIFKAIPIFIVIILYAT